LENLLRKEEILTKYRENQDFSFTAVLAFWVENKYNELNYYIYV